MENKDNKTKGYLTISIVIVIGLIIYALIGLGLQTGANVLSSLSPWFLSILGLAVIFIVLKVIDSSS